MTAWLVISRLRARRGVENHTAATVAAAMRRWRMRRCIAACWTVFCSLAKEKLYPNEIASQLERIRGGAA
jgi:hypothetical protein